MRAESFTRSIGGTEYTIDRQAVITAASEIPPTHAQDLTQRELFVMIGTGLYYGPDLIEKVTGAKARLDGREAYDLLGSIGFRQVRADWGHLSDNWRSSK
ncbi:hypothetical protein EAO71_03520 [Streptomyces sp. ms191]|uniref:hypothetical protein n=1 Tax=unclassified Streptomyces TaxID=2593676 RepID=UPI0011CE3BDD|nr:hypothetical protein [Streptomyces sp. ms191]TXS32992.1 hypothetical protein EAO71_03520 [Streptomyces sp. ms191]